MEQQNDERLDSLYSTINSIKNVTIDIHSDSLSQNRLLDQTGNQFESFRTQLTGSATRFGRSVQSGQSQTRVIVYSVGAVIGLFILYRLLR